MEQVLEIFMALLKSEIMDAPLQSEIFQIITGDILPQLYEISKKHNLDHMVAVALRKAKIIKEDGTFHEKGNSLLDNVSKDFMWGLYLGLDRYENMKYEQGKICCLLEQEDIPFVLLKGTVIGNHYQEPWMRLSSDIDILVREEDIEKAKEIIVSELNYRIEKYNYHDISLYSPQDFHLELHFKILENEDNIDVLLENVWDYVSPIAEGKSQAVMTNEYMLFYAFAHMYYHFLNGGCGVRYFIDVWVLENNLDYNKTVVEEMCKKCGIDTFVYYAEKLSRVWFGNEEHDSITIRMQSYVIAGGVFGNINSRVMVGKTKTKGRIGYLLQRIFTPCDELCVSFPLLNKYPSMYPIYLVKRWIRIFDKRTSRRAYEEIKLNQEISQEKVSELKRLFEELKL